MRIDRFAARSAALVGAAVLVATVLGGCAITGGGGAGGGGWPGGSDGASTPTPNGGPTGTETPGATSTSPPSRASAHGAACLVGTWQLRNETFEAAMAGLLRDAPEVPADLRASMRIELSGESFIRFADGGDFAAWREGFTMTISGAGQRMQHVLDAGDVATYDADDEVVWVRDFVEVYSETSMHIDGIGSVAIDGGGAPTASIEFFGHRDAFPGPARDLPDGAARYHCAADALTLHGDGGMSAAFTRAPAAVTGPGVAR